LKFSGVCLFVMLSLSAISAEARVFSYQTNWIAAYVRGTAGQSSVDAVGDTSGTETTFGGDEVPYNFGGELGFSFLLGEKLAVRFGIEGLQAKNFSSSGNRSTDGVKLMDVTSKVTAFSPVLTAEWYFKTMENSRAFWFAGAGYTTVKVANDYNTTVIGNADFNGGTPIPAYTENWYADTISYNAGIGYEMYVLDNVTMSFEAGYRMMDVTKFNYGANSKAIRGTAATNVTKGSVVKDNGGKNAGLDLGGPFAAFSIKFYIPPLN
jgi:opacity protein-like surface antigen